MPNSTMDPDLGFRDNPLDSDQLSDDTDRISQHMSEEDDATSGGSLRNTGNNKEDDDHVIVGSPPTPGFSGGTAGGSLKLGLRNRTNRKPISHERTRHKRQTLQDMARPLKQWLYQHRENPYPTKSEKLSLAMGSQMTLTQVSNWFANARRRLKNTVRDPNLSWNKRIKLYNSHVEGNAELLSVSSDDSVWPSDDEQNAEDDTKSNRQFAPHPQTPQRLAHAHMSNDYPKASMEFETVHDYCADDPQGSPHKYKSSILQRYLNDAYEHSINGPVSPSREELTRIRHMSGSCGSRDYEEFSSSSRSTPTNEHHNSVFEESTEELQQIMKRRRTSDENSPQDEDMYWKEISAAMALTSLAMASRSSPFTHQART